MKQVVWLSYDLGEDGDLTHLYSWLKGHKAEECGNSVAFLTFEAEANDFDSFMEHLAKSIEDEVHLNESARLYAISRKGESIAGRFIHGARKPNAPWSDIQ